MVLNFYLVIFLLFVDIPLVFAQDGVAPSANDICPIKVGSPLPSIALQTMEGSIFDLNGAVRRKPTVLIFYRGGWCPYCNRQLHQIQAVHSQLIDLGYQIIAVSADKPSKLRETVQKDSLDYLLLSDRQMTASRKLGLAFKVDEATVDRYKRMGLDLEGASGERHHVLPVPAVFVLGMDGAIQFEYVNPNYKVRLDPDVLLIAAKKALKPAETRSK